MASPLHRPLLQPTLIRVDIQDPEQKAIYQAQRTICGWKHENSTVDKFFTQARLGLRVLYWVCIPLGSIDELGLPVSPSPEGSAATTCGRSRHRFVVSADGKDALGLVARDHAASGSRLSASESSHLALPLIPPEAGLDASFVPAGHVSVDLGDLEAHPTPLLGTGNGSTVAISTLFVLPVFRKYGLASSTMVLAEEMIRTGEVFASQARDTDHTGEDDVGVIGDVAPFKVAKKLQVCKELALTALSERHWVLDDPTGNQMWVARGGVGVGEPRVGSIVRYHGPWYEKLGYKRVAEMPKYAHTMLDNDTLNETFWWAEIWTKKL